MECFICKDEFENINKICVCNSSYLCNDCLNLTNDNRIKKCPICRRDLECIKQYKYCNILFYLLVMKFTLLIILSIYMLGPLYLMYNNNFNDESVIIFLQSVSLILFVEPFTNCLFSKIFELNIILYQIIKLIYIFFIYMTMYITDNFIIKFYLPYIQIPCFIIPSVFLFIIIVYRKIELYLDVLYIKSCKKKIDYKKNLLFQYVTSV
jgi:hypothetical protein